MLQRMRVLLVLALLSVLGGCAQRGTPCELFEPCAVCDPGDPCDPCVTARP